MVMCHFGMEVNRDGRGRGEKGVVLADSENIGVEQGEEGGG